MKLTSRDIIEILKTIKQLGYRKFRLQHDDLTLEVDTESGDALTPELDKIQTSEANTLEAASTPPRPEVAPHTPTPVVALSPSDRPKSTTEDAVTVTAPITGTFYRTPSPGAPPFVDVGSKVRADDTVCIIEIMKLFNSIPAGVAGTVLEICVENEASVRAGDVVMWIKPDVHAE